MKLSTGKILKIADEYKLEIDKLHGSYSDMLEAFLCMDEEYDELMIEVQQSIDLKMIMSLDIEAIKANAERILEEAVDYYVTKIRFIDFIKATNENKTSDQ